MKFFFETYEAYCNALVVLRNEDITDKGYDGDAKCYMIAIDFGNE